MTIARSLRASMWLPVLEAQPVGPSLGPQEAAQEAAAGSRGGMTQSILALLGQGAVRFRIECCVLGAFRKLQDEVTQGPPQSVSTCSSRSRVTVTS